MSFVFIRRYLKSSFLVSSLSFEETSLWDEDIVINCIYPDISSCSISYSLVSVSWLRIIISADSTPVIERARP